MSRVTDKTLVDELHNHHSYTPHFIKQALQEIHEVIRQGLLADGVVTISKFGTFRLKEVKSRRGVHPQTGAVLTIPAHRRVIFTPGKALREMIEPYPQPPIPLLDTPDSKSAQNNGATKGDEADGVLDTVNASGEEGMAGEAPPATLPEPGVNNLSALHHLTAARADEEEKPGPADTEHDIDLGVFDEETRSNKRKVLLGIAMILVISTIIALLLLPNRESGSTVDAMALAKTEVTETSLEANMQLTGYDSQPAPQAETAVTQAQTGAYFVARHYRMTHGDTLWGLSEEHYHEPLLWPLIFQANGEVIGDPDHIKRGTDILLPELQGSPDRLSSDDMLHLAEGYQRLYDFYRRTGHPDSGYTLLMANHYTHAAEAQVSQ